MPSSSPRRDGQGKPRSRWRFTRSEEHTSELQSQSNLVCRLLLEKKKKSPVPALLRLVNDNDPFLRRMAAGSLRQIDPDAAVQSVAHVVVLTLVLRRRCSTRHNYC